MERQRETKRSRRLSLSLHFCFLDFPIIFLIPASSLLCLKFRFWKWKGYELAINFIRMLNFTSPLNAQFSLLLAGLFGPATMQISHRKIEMNVNRRLPRWNWLSIETLRNIFNNVHVRRLILNFKVVDTY